MIIATAVVWAACHLMATFLPRRERRTLAVGLACGVAVAIGAAAALGNAVTLVGAVT